MRKLIKRKRNPADLPINRIIAADYIAEVAKTISNKVHRTIRDLSIKDLNEAVKKIYSLQEDLNIIGHGLPKYSDEELKRKWANDPERWI